MIKINLLRKTKKPLTIDLKDITLKAKISRKHLEGSIPFLNPIIMSSLKIV